MASDATRQSKRSCFLQPVLGLAWMRDIYSWLFSSLLKPRQHSHRWKCVLFEAFCTRQGQKPERIQDFGQGGASGVLTPENGIPWFPDTDPGNCQHDTSLTSPLLKPKRPCQATFAHFVGVGRPGFPLSLCAPLKTEIPCLHNDEILQHHGYRSVGMALSYTLFVLDELVYFLHIPHHSRFRIHLCP